MIFLTKKKQKQIMNAIVANQIIFNAFESLGGIDKFQAYSQFCDNSAGAIFDLGGMKALEEARGVIFKDDKYTGEEDN